MEGRMGVGTEKGLERGLRFHEHRPHYTASESHPILKYRKWANKFDAWREARYSYCFPWKIIMLHMAWEILMDCYFNHPGELELERIGGEECSSRALEKSNHHLFLGLRAVRANGRSSFCFWDILSKVNLCIQLSCETVLELNISGPGSVLKSFVFVFVRTASVFTKREKTVSKSSMFVIIQVRIH